MIYSFLQGTLLKIYFKPDYMSPGDLGEGLKGINWAD